MAIYLFLNFKKNTFWRRRTPFSSLSKLKSIFGPKFNFVLTPRGMTQVPSARFLSAKVPEGIIYRKSSVCLPFLSGLGSRQIINGSGSWSFSQAAPPPAPGFFFERLRLQGAKKTGSGS